MSADREARSALRDALIAYMRGEIRTFAFDDANTRCMDVEDPGLREVARALWTMHDDLIDHPISVSEKGWHVLNRVVAFLATDLGGVPAGRPLAAFWPFRDAAEFSAHEHLSRSCGLPQFNPEVHGPQINPWRYRIPTLVGIALIAACLAMMFGLALFTASR